MRNSSMSKPFLATVALATLPAYAYYHSRLPKTNSSTFRINQGEPFSFASIGGFRFPADYEGLQRPVTIIRDTWGVPHIYARNEHDLFFAQGFARYDRAA